MWSLDLGTTNTLLARWDDDAGKPRLLELPRLCRQPGEAEPLLAPQAVPSAVHVLDHPTWLARHFSIGPLAVIGREAAAMNALRPRPNFAPSFKRALGLDPLLNLARGAGRSFNAREIAALFLRELFAEARAASGEHIRDLVITAPIEAFEAYRAELSSICRSLGVRKVRFLDEPVAAAIGYGLGLTQPRRVLVVDFGGGTLHLALVRVALQDVQAGKTEVLAKAARDVGGDFVDRWLSEELCQKLGYDFEQAIGDDASLWRRLALTEARRVKEAVYFQEQVTCELSAPRELRAAASSSPDATSLEYKREDLAALLQARGVYAMLESALNEVLASAGANGVSEADIDEVLMVGGSTLLPGVYPIFEKRLGRGRVRAWRPFEAVAYGACVVAANRVEPADFIVHDYALLTHDLTTRKQQHTVIVPSGTRFPSRPDLWKRQLVPTCSLGEPETLFKLVICELAKGGAGQDLVWDADGKLHRLAIAEKDGERIVVKLNEVDPALGRLDPPHSPQDQKPRLEVSFGINEDRWLCATVFDLMTKKILMRSEPVVRLL
jgi:molecular chaperone DnaK (HSP70)